VVAVGPSNFGSLTTNNQVRGTGTVTSVDVRVSATHANDGDLAFKLKHGGTTVDLATHLGGSGDNYTRTLFTDGAATSDHRRQPAVRRHVSSRSRP